MVKNRVAKWFIGVLVSISASVSGAAQPPDIIDLNPGGVIILPTLNSDKEIEFSPKETWIYEPRITCSSSDPDTPISVIVEIIPRNPLIRPTQEDGTCATLTSFTMDKHLLVAGEKYTFKITYDSFEGEPDIPPFAVVQSILLVPKVEPSAWDSGLLANGNFIGPALWTLHNGTYHEMIQGVGEAELGDLIFTNPSTTNSAASSIEQPFSVSTTGIYRLTFSCQTIANLSIYRGRYQVRITATNDPVIAPAVFDGSCASSWETLTHDILLLANRSYDFQWIYRQAGHPMLAKSIRIDNLAIQYIGQPEFFDSGIVKNGGFAGYDAWDLSPSTFFLMHRGVTNTQLGAILFTDPEYTDNNITSSISQQVYPTATDIYRLNVSCRTLSNISNRSTKLKYVVKTLGDSLALPAIMTGTCNNQWTELTFNHLLLSGKIYQIELIYDMPSVVGLHVMIDNLSLMPTATLDDPETGLITNGGFVGETAWQFSPQAYYSLNKGFSVSQLGAVEIKNLTHQVSQVILPNVTDTYSVRFSCKNTSGFASTVTSVEYRVADINDSTIPPVVYSFSCPTQWKTFTFEHELSGGLHYQVSLKYTYWSRAGTALLIDNLSIFPEEIPVPEARGSCIEWLAENPKAQNGTYRIDPDGVNTDFPAYDAYCDMEHGGLTFLYAYDVIQTSEGPRPVLPTRKLTDHDSCKDLALNLFAPRSENEFKIGRDYLNSLKVNWGTGQGLGPLGIYSNRGTCNTAGCTDQPLPPQEANSSGAPEWKSIAGDEWWASNVNFSGGFLGIYNSPNWVGIDYCGDDSCEINNQHLEVGDVNYFTDDHDLENSPYTNYLCASPLNLTLPTP